jgi:hypothetical protein
VPPPAGASDIAVEGVTCLSSACEVVGYGERGAATTGFVVSLSHGRPTALHRAPGESLYGISCAEATLCYADGFDSLGGIIVPVRRGAVGAAAHVPGDLFGMTCLGTACVAAGEQLPANRAKSRRRSTACC